MRLLLDTNIYLEMLLDQSRADEVRALLVKISDHDFFLTDFSLHSIGLVFFRRRQQSGFDAFVKDIVIRAGTGVLSLEIADYRIVSRASQRFTLDFDDAYQYAVCEKFGLELVSFDGDFDRTPRGRKTPETILGAA